MKQQTTHPFNKMKQALSALLVTIYVLTMLGDMTIYVSHSLHHHFTSTPKNHFHKNLYTPHHHHSDFVDKLLAMMTGDVDTDSQKPIIITDSKTPGKHFPAASEDLPQNSNRNSISELRIKPDDDIYLLQRTPPPKRGA